MKALTLEECINTYGGCYNYSEETYELIGEVTNKHYKLGQRLKIRVKDTDTFMRTIDFELAEEEDGKGKYQADREQ